MEIWQGEEERSHVETQTNRISTMFQREQNEQREQNVSKVLVCNQGTYTFPRII